MAATPENPTEFFNATAELVIAGRKIRLEMPVPAGPVRLIELLPLFRYLTDAFVGLAVDKTQAEGLTVSCRKGCGACCRQVVPIAEIEARRLRDLVDEMPEPRRSEILARFERARQRLREAGLLEKLHDPNRVVDDDLATLGLDYFHLGIACPFLEAESCSIYAERPLICREYLVVTPAENCAQPTADTVKPVKLTIHTSRTIRDLNAAWSVHATRWVPLALALEWVDAHSDESPRRPGTELMREVLGRLTGSEIPKPG